ncbi:PAS domain S-box protein [Malaciobacter mytili]|uniref:PAS domain S-box protein n=1 Tax=Malaciobacter mytili TaxID=603050 RepID=UPI003A8BE53E
MKKPLFIVLTFIFLIVSLVYTTDQSNKKIDEFFKFQKNISYLISTNKNFDIFMSSSISYNNFDVIQKDIFKIKDILKNIQYENYFEKLKLDDLKVEFSLIEKLLKEKMNSIEKLKSTSAVLNNSYRYIQKLYEELDNKRFIKIYTRIIGLEFNSEINIDKLKQSLDELSNLTPKEKIFVRHAENILNYYEKFHQQKQKIRNLSLNNKLESFEIKYNNYSDVFIKDIKSVLWIIIILLSISIVLFLFYYSKIAYQTIQLNRFKQAVENSDNIIMTTDFEQKIKYVNENFIKHTGYTYSDVIGKRASILKSGLNSKHFYEKLNKTIYSGQRWYGEFINRRKDGELSYEKTTISPIFNEKGKIIEFLAIKLDVTKEKKIEKDLKEKEHILAQQSKMVAMHEMLDSIAHQWRQPLSTISTAASGMKLNKEYDSLDDDTFNDLIDVIVDNTLYLSRTIDSFKTFFKTNHENTLFNIKNTINKIIDLIGYKFNENKIEFIPNIQEVNMEGLEHELIQSLVNVINNAQDALVKNVKEGKRLIFLDVSSKDKNSIVIKIKDNGLGIDEKIIENIFEPYFTTKHKSQGTGIGLYMTYEIISKHFYGTIDVKNCEYTYEQNKYKGAEFTIIIPSKKNDRK